MKIIITGATGFIGRNIAEKLHDEGIQIIATGRSLQVGKELEQKGMTFIKMDILAADDLKKMLTAADYLIHCAARTGDWGNYNEFYVTNVIGTENVIQACKAHGIKKIIYISTPSMYYSGQDRVNVSETEPLPKKQFNYGKTKQIAEEKLLALQQEGYQVIVLRPRAVYGKYDNTLVPRILQLAGKKRLPIINNGNALIDITYIENLIHAVKCCFAAPTNAWGEIYNISNSAPITVRDWFSHVLEIFDRPFHPQNIPLPIAKTIAGIVELLSHLPFGNKKPTLTLFSVGYMGKTLTMSIDKAKQKLNYTPLVSNHESFKMVKEWYHSNKNRP